MNRRKITILVILFILSVIACTRILSHSEVRNVEVACIFASGIFAGALIAQVLPGEKQTPQ
jgi:hypothetical protein